MLNQDEVARLNRLIVDCHDDCRTFDDAAAAHPDYSRELSTLVGRRDDYVQDLAGVLHEEGASAARRGSALAWWHRLTSSLRVALAGTTNAGDSLRGCVRQERRTVEHYERAVRMGSSSPELDQLLRDQLTQLEVDLARVRYLQGWS